MQSISSGHSDALKGIQTWLQRCFAVVWAACTKTDAEAYGCRGIRDDCEPQEGLPIGDTIPVDPKGIVPGKVLRFSCNKMYDQSFAKMSVPMICVLAFRRNFLESDCCHPMLVKFVQRNYAVEILL
jgi:hypothetical protein